MLWEREGDIDIEAMLQKPLFAHLATHSEHGPRSSPVWFLWEQQCFWIIGNRAVDTFVGRIEAEPRCALSITELDLARGLVMHIGVRAEGTVEDWDRARAKRKLARYLGADESRWDRSVFTLSPHKPLCWIRVAPVTAVARNQSYRPSRPRS